MATYYRVYQDKTEIDGDSCIVSLENIKELSDASIEDSKIDDSLPIVFEPIEMTEDEFENLPEFKGF